MNSIEFADQYITGLTDTLKAFDGKQFQIIVDLVLKAYRDERSIFTMGNGGSGATASHFACDINKGCCLDLEKKFKMICLNDNIPTMLAYANDISYDFVFVEQLKNFFRPEDLVIGISGSGNSKNVLKAIHYANKMGGRTIGLTGFSGGDLAQIAKASFVVGSNDMQKVEDVHLIITHIIMQVVHNALHGSTGCE
jgi:D-sedoheptulose 7-phosphate isomerase